MTEQELREMIKEECLNYKTNFRGFDELHRMQDNFYTADTPGDYRFTGCPNSYYCLSDAEDYCSVDHPYCDDECEQCWKNAFASKIDSLGV